MQELAADVLVEVSGTLSRLIGIAALMVGAAAVLYDGKVRPFSVVHGFIVLFLAFGCFSYLWSAQPATTFSRLITNVQLLVMVLLIAQFGSREDESSGLVAAYVVGSFISLFELFRRYSMGAAGSVLTTRFYGRFTAFENNPNDYALALALGIPMAWYLATRRMSLVTTFLGYAYVALGTLGVLLTGSRGGLLAAAMGAMIIPASMFVLGGRVRVGAIAIIIIGSVLAIRLTPAGVWERLATLEDISEGKNESELEGVNIRTVIWSNGFKEFRTNPQTATIGVGAGAYRFGVEAIYGKQLVAHNVFVSILLELGIIGMSVFITIVAMLGLSIRFLPKEEKLLWIFVFACWFVGVMFVTWEHTKNTWFVIGVLAARTVTARQGHRAGPGFLASLFSRTRMGWRLRRPAY